MCDLAYVHRLEKADRDQQQNLTLVAAGLAEFFDYRAAVDEWLGEDIKPAERDELREALGV